MATPVTSDAPVLVLSTHTLSRSALAITLANELGVRVDHAVPPAFPAEPRVSILDGLNLPLQTVPQLIRSAVQRSASAILLYDSARPSPDLLSAAQFAGVHSTFDVRGDIRSLAERARYALANRSWRQDWTSESWMRALTQDVAELTPRERQVATALCGSPDASLDEFATALDMRANTVRTHIANIRRKLPGRFTGNRQALATAILERGWLD